MPEGMKFDPNEAIVKEGSNKGNIKNVELAYIGADAENKTRKFLETPILGNMIHKGELKNQKRSKMLGLNTSTGAEVPQSKDEYVGEVSDDMGSGMMARAIAKEQKQQGLDKIEAHNVGASVLQSQERLANEGRIENAERQVAEQVIAILEGMSAEEREHYDSTEYLSDKIHILESKGIQWPNIEIRGRFGETKPYNPNVQREAILKPEKFVGNSEE